MSMQMQPIFAHLPWFIKQSIVDHLDAVNKLNVRRCSKELNTHVLKSPTQYKFLTVSVHQDCVAIVVAIDWEKKIFLKFQNNSDGAGYTVKEEKTNWEEKSLEKKYEEGDDVTGSVEYLMRKVFGNKNIGFYNCHFELASSHESAEYLERSKRFLSLLKASLLEKKHQISVEEVFIKYYDNHEDLLNILSLLKPGYLNKIALFGRSSGMEQVMELDQWKRAKKLEAADYQGALITGFSEMSNFEDVKLECAFLSLQTVKNFVKLISDNLRMKRINVAALGSDKRDIKRYMKVLKTSAAYTDLRIKFIRNSEIFIERVKRSRRNASKRDNF